MVITNSHTHTLQMSLEWKLTQLFFVVVLFTCNTGTAACKVEERKD